MLVTGKRFRDPSMTEQAWEVLVKFDLGTPWTSHTLAKALNTKNASGSSAALCNLVQRGFAEKLPKKGKYIQYRLVTKDRPKFNRAMPEGITRNRASLLKPVQSRAELFRGLREALEQADDALVRAYNLLDTLEQG